MFSWLRGPAKAAAVWDVAGSPDHTYVVFGDASLDDAIAPARSSLDAALARASAINREDIHADDDPEIVAELDDEGSMRAWIDAYLTAERVDVDEARAGLGDVDANAAADATNAIRVTAPVAALVQKLAASSLLAVACGIARGANGIVYDTIGKRIVPDEIVADPLAGLALGSLGYHVRIVPSEEAGGTSRHTTIGLRKVCIFELSLGGVPAGLSRASDIVGALAQALIEDRPPAAGPWKPTDCFVSETYAQFFANESTPKKHKSDFVLVWPRPIESEPGTWAIEDARKPFDDKALAAIVRRFDADRDRG